jgi:hypothetical protein
MSYCRLTNLLKEHKPHFVRVAGYMVADLLQYFETYTLYPEVKVSGYIFSGFCGFEMFLVEIKAAANWTTDYTATNRAHSHINFTS